MALAHFRMLINELLDKDTDIFTEEAPQIILGIKSAALMAKNGKDTKHTRQIYIREHFLRNGEKYKIHKIDWCEVGMQLLDIATKNVGQINLNPRMKYIKVSLEN